MSHVWKRILLRPNGLAEKCNSQDLYLEYQDIKDQLKWIELTIVCVHL